VADDHGAKRATFVVSSQVHQDLDGPLVKGQAKSTNDNGTGGPMACRFRLGGILNDYHRVVA
jgi:hypothetical protein